MFLSPLALLGIGLLALPLIIHALARQRAQRFDFPSLEFIRETKDFRLRPRRLQNPLLLLIRLIALGLLITGLSRPQFFGAASRVRTHVILIDMSLSMSVPGTATAARDAARSVISKLATDEQAGIIAFSSDAVVLSEPIQARDGLLSALNRYATDAAGTDFDKGFAAAAEMFGRTAGADGTIDLISDFQSSNLASARGVGNWPPSVHLNPIAVGSQLSLNSFVDRCAVSRTSSGIVMTTREISSNGGARHGVVNRWPMSADLRPRPDFSWAIQSNGEITGSVSSLTADEFDKDDQHFFSFDTPREERALIVESQSEPEPFFQAALKASSDPFVVLSVDKQSELPADVKLSSYTLVVFTVDKDLSQSDLSKLDAYVRGGGTLWLQLSPSLNTSSAAFTSPALWELFPFESLSRLEVPAEKSLGSLNIETNEMQGIGSNVTTAFSGITVKEHFKLKKRDKTATLLQWSDGEAALLALHQGQGTVLCWPFTLDRSTTSLGIAPAFPVLVAAIFSNAAATSDNSFEVGQPVWLNTKPDTRVTIFVEGSAPVVTDSRTLIQDPLHVIHTPGIYRFEYDAKVRYIAFNPPASESDLLLATPDQVQNFFSVMPTEHSAAHLPSKSAAIPGDRNWRVLIGCAFLVLVAELLFWIRDRHRGTADSFPSSGAVS